MWCVTGPLTMVLAAPNTELVPLQDRTQLLDSLLLEDSADAAEQSIKASYARGRVQSGISSESTPGYTERRWIDSNS